MKAAIILENGFEDIEALGCKDILNRGGVEVTLFGSEKVVKTSHSTNVIVDELINDNIKEYDIIILPGGIPGTYNLRDDKRIINYLTYFNNKNKLIAAICAFVAIGLLELVHSFNIKSEESIFKIGVLENKLATVYPDKEFVEILGSNYVDKKVHIDKNIITACGAGQTFNFSFEILRQLGINPENIKKSMQI